MGIYITIKGFSVKFERGMDDIKITEIQRLAFGLETSVKKIIAEI
jgi:hypothetical protein